MLKLKLLIIILLFPVFVYSAPTIVSTDKSTVANGESIILTTTAAGTKAVPGPSAYYNFDDGTPDALILESDLVDKDNGYYYKTDQSHAGGQSAKATPAQNPNGKFLYYEGFPAEGVTEFYISFWEQREYLTGDSIAQLGNQVKHFSIRSGTDPELTTCGMGTNFWYQETAVPGIFETLNEYTYIVHTDNVQNTVYWDAYAPPESEWYRIEIYGKRASGDSVADGTWIMRIVQPSTPLNQQVYTQENVITNTAGDLVWRYAVWRNDPVNCESGDCSLNIWLDNIYIDLTQARVELCNNTTLATSTNREVQNMTAHSATEIAISSIIQGSIPNGTAYLIVVDENGLESNAFGITLGTASTGGAPVALGTGAVINLTTGGATANIYPN